MLLADREQIPPPLRKIIYNRSFPGLTRDLHMKEDTVRKTQPRTGQKISFKNQRI